MGKNKDRNLGLLLLLLVFTVSFIYGFKHLLLLHEQDWQIRNTVFFTSFEAWDVDHYLTQLREVGEGHDLLSNAYLADYKQTQRSPWPLFPNLALTFLGKLLHLDVPYLAVFMDFVFPSLIFLLAYWWLATLSRARYIALLGAFLLVLTPHLARMDILAYIGVGLMQRGFSPPILQEAHCYYCFSGTTNPQFTYNLFLAALLFFSKGLLSSKKRFWILAAFFGIATSYSYVYFSSYLYVVLGVSALALWFAREREHSLKTWGLLGSILLGSLPFWLPLLKFTSPEMNQMAFATKDRTPLIFSSFINAHLGVQLLLTLVLCGLLLYWVNKGAIQKIPGLLGFALLLSGIVCLEQHVITGIRVQPWHYDAYVNPQSTILVLTLIAMEVLPNVSFRKIPVRPVLLYGGVGIAVISMALHPAFVVTYISADGVLTPAFHSLLQVVHIVGLCLGCSLIGCRILLGTRFSWLLSRLAEHLSRFFRRIPYGVIGKVFYGILIVYVAWDVGLGQYQYYHQTLKPKYAYLQQLDPAFRWLNEHTPAESVVLGSPDHTSTNSIIPIYTHNNVYVAFHSQYYTLPSEAEIYDRVYTSFFFMGIRSREDFEEHVAKSWLSHGAFDYTEYQKRLNKDVYSELTKYRVDYVIYGPCEQEHFRIDPQTSYSFLEEEYDDGVVKIYRVL